MTRYQKLESEKTCLECLFDLISREDLYWICISVGSILSFAALLLFCGDMDGGYLYKVNLVINDGCTKVHKCMKLSVKWLPTCGKIVGEIHTCYFDMTMCYTDLNHSCSEADKQLSADFLKTYNNIRIIAIGAMMVGIILLVLAFLLAYSFSFVFA